MAEPLPWGVLQPSADRGPGLVATAARLRSIDVRIHCNGSLPRAREVAALVVLGDVPAAEGLLAEAIGAELPVLALGGGARLLARVLGAPVDRAAGGEVCVAPVYLTDEGCVDRVLGRAPSPVDLLHDGWGGYGLPSGAVGLAESAVDPAPAFRFRRAYGVPFHLEADAEIAARYDGCPRGFPTRASIVAGVAVLDAFACHVRDVLVVDS